MRGARGEIDIGGWRVRYARGGKQHNKPLHTPACGFVCQNGSLILDCSMLFSGRLSCFDAFNHVFKDSALERTALPFHLCYSNSNCRGGR